MPDHTKTRPLRLRCWGLQQPVSPHASSGYDYAGLLSGVGICHIAPAAASWTGTHQAEPKTGAQFKHNSAFGAAICGVLSTTVDGSEEPNAPWLLFL